MKVIIEELPSEAKFPAYSITVPPQSVVTLPATGETLKWVVAELAQNLISHNPAKGVGEVTLQATELPLTL